MQIFIESLKRLYKEKKIDLDTINELYETGKITLEEKLEIVNSYLDA